MRNFNRNYQLENNSGSSRKKQCYFRDTFDVLLHVASSDAAEHLAFAVFSRVSDLLVTYEHGIFLRYKCLTWLIQ